MRQRDIQVSPRDIKITFHIPYPSTFMLHLSLMILCKLEGSSSLRLLPYAYETTGVWRAWPYHVSSSGQEGFKIVLENQNTRSSLVRWQTNVRVLNNSKCSLTTFMQLSMLSLRVGEGLLTGNWLRGPVILEDEEKLEMSDMPPC